MPTALWEGFVGGTYQALSPFISADQAVNVYVETRQVGDAPKQKTLYGTPGLTPYLTVGTLGCRGLFAQDGRMWGVWGNTLYEINTTTGTATSYPVTLQDDGGPASFASNGQGGNQLGVVSGGSGGMGGLYVLNLTTNVLAEVTLPFAGPVMIAFLDGYALINQHDSPIVWYSALEDMTTWDALDFFARSNTSDNIKAIAVTRDRVWTLGSATTTLFYDSGDTDTPFLPYPGTTFQTGIVTHWAFNVFNDVLYWLAQSDTGVARLVKAADPSVVTISTPPIARFFDNCPSLANAEMLSYGQEEHIFVAITCPDSPDKVQTYCYDELEQLWHARAGWDTTSGVYARWRARGCVEAAGRVFVGDYATGALYTLDLDTYTDNGQIIRRERIAPYLGAENQLVFLDQVELGTQPGVGIASGQGSNPQIELQVSRDGARTWISAGLAGVGALGNYAARTIWRNLGRVRMDRLVLRMIQTDPVKTVWGPGLWIRSTRGTSQL